MADNKPTEVKIKKGTFYISSKQDKGEGWTKNEFKDPQNKDETLIRYHKELSLQGKVNYVGFQDDKFKGKVLVLIIAGNDESYSLKVPVKDTGGTVKTTNSYYNSIIGSLENVSKGQEVKMFVNNKYEDKNGRLYRNIVVLTPDNKLIKSNFHLIKDVPDWDKKKIKDEFGEDKIQWDATKANKFYMDLGNKVVENFGKQSSKDAKTEEKRQTPKEDNTNNNNDGDDMDDLPF